MAPEHITVSSERCAIHPECWLGVCGRLFAAGCGRLCLRPESCTADGGRGAISRRLERDGFRESDHRAGTFAARAAADCASVERLAETEGLTAHAESIRVEEPTCLRPAHAVHSLEVVSSAAGQSRWLAAGLQREYGRLLAARAAAVARDWMANIWRAIPSASRSRRSSRRTWESKPAEVLLTNGTDEAIHLICETYLEPGDEALIVRADFRHVRNLCGGDRGESDSGAGGREFQLPDGASAGAHQRAHAVDCGRQSEQSHRHTGAGRKICCASRKPRRTRLCWWMRRILSSR